MEWAACRSLAEAAEAVRWALGASNIRDIYLCLSTQRHCLKEVTDAMGQKLYRPLRSRDNAAQIKTLFLDIDFKGGEHGYDSQEHALKELARFLKETGLPKPGVLVLSGGGVHVYWPLARALTPGEWQPLASALAEATKRHNLKCDSQCTVDVARVLRIPGTKNCKLDTPRPVTLAGCSDQDYDVEALAKSLEPYCVAVPQRVALPPPPAALLAKFSGLQDQAGDLAAGIEKREFPPIKLDDVATECAFVREAIVAGGLAYPQPLWNLTTLLSTFTEGGRADAHRMADKHPEYTKESTDELFDRKTKEKDQIGLGWPSCAAIKAAGCTACQSCKHFGNGKSPLHFGRQVAAAQPAKSALATPDPLRFTCLSLKAAVDLINTEYFVLRSTGKIYRQDTDGELHALRTQDFKIALGGRCVLSADDTGGPKRRSAADAWVSAPERREYLGFQYSPNNVGAKQGCLNLWTGWGDVTPANGDCSIITDHILKVVADGDPAKSDFLLNWLADILQNPTRKPGVCIVLRGRQGCGKTVVGAIMRRLIGPRNVLTTSEKDRILGRFNASVMNKILIIGEEMIFAGDRATIDKLKHLITGQTLPIEFKFGDALEIESHHRLLLASNHEQVFQAAGEERRFVIYDVSDARRGDADYFDKLYAVADGRDGPTAAAFMKFLLDRDLATFKPWKAQQCFADDVALTRQKRLSLSAPLAWLQEVVDTVAGQGLPGDYDWRDGLPYPRTLSSGLPCGSDSKWPPRFPRRAAVDAFRNWASKAKPFGASEYTGSPERFWAEICRVIPRVQTNRQIAGGVRTVAIDLADVQNNFNKHLRGETV
jgi:Family of unknown function (DUF5906)